ncbi:alpha/beta fold hydrolase [Telmatospirillum siberiense]|nr:alpha/beta hydrolase [Telmatospirillum siberiense]
MTSDDSSIPDNDKLFIRTQSPADGQRDRMLSYVLANDGGAHGLTLFFCHGGGGNKNQWRRQWSHFAAQGARLVAWDCLGHGCSAQPRRPNAYDGALTIGDYLEVVRRFGSRRNILVAHSYGCLLTLAVLLALREADELNRIAGVLLLAPPSPLRPLALGPMAYLPAFVLEWLRPRLTTAFRHLAWHPDTDPDLVAFEERATRGNAMRTVKAVFSGAVRLDPASLGALSLPIDIAVGAEDRLTPPNQAQDLAALLPGARLHVVDQAAHQVMLERPEAINALLETLLASASVTAGGR